MRRFLSVPVALVCWVSTGVCWAENEISADVDKVECGVIYVSGSITLDCGYDLGSECCPEVTVIVFQCGGVELEGTEFPIQSDKTFSGTIYGLSSGEYKLYVRVTIHETCACPPSAAVYATGILSAAIP